MKKAENNSQSNQISKYRKVLLRIKKANEYYDYNVDNPTAIKKAIDRFEMSVLPECKEVGIPSHFAWALLIFGKLFLDKEFPDNKPNP